MAPFPSIFRGKQPSRARYYSDRRRVLTASAAAADKGSDDGGSAVTKLHEPWQKRVFGYYDMIGECWNPAQFYARGLSKIRYYPATREQDGTYKEIETGPEVDALAAVSPIAGDYGRLLFLIGEGRLCQSRLPEEQGGSEDDPVVWEFLSPTEVTLSNDGKTIQRRIPNGGVDGKIEYTNISDEPEGDEPGPGEMRMWRFWRKHPKNSMLADSPMRPVLDLYEQLWWLTMRERAYLQSRIADVGLMLIPEEIDFSPDGDAEEDAVEGEDPEADPFQAYVGEMFMATIMDPGTAAAAVPGVIRGPAEFLDEKVFRMLHTSDGQGSMETSEREQAIIQRLAVALDMPPAALTGLGTLNHWNAWKNEDEKWQHIEPIAELFARDVQDSYLRPLLIASGDSPEQAADVYVRYDNSEFVRDPDRGATAIAMNKQGLLNAEATREANGWGEDAKQSEEEHLEYLAISLRDPTLVGGAAPAPPAEGNPPAEEDAQPTNEQNGQAATRARDYAVLRARAVAGGSLRSWRRSCPDCFEGTDSVRPEDLLAKLGPEKVAKLVDDPGRIVSIMLATYNETLSKLGYLADLEAAGEFFEETLYTNEPWPARQTS